MRSGEAATAQRGFTYLLLLFVLALAAAALAALGESWTTAAQREREDELLFRGRQIAAALAAYRDSTPAGQPRAPLVLAELLVDQRHEPPRFLLRRSHADPFTGQPDWWLQLDEQGRIVALASRSRQPALRLHGAPPLRAGTNPKDIRVGDWLFEPPPAATRRNTDERRR